MCPPIHLLPYSSGGLSGDIGKSLLAQFSKLQNTLKIQESTSTSTSGGSSEGVMGIDSTQWDTASSNKNSNSQSYTAMETELPLHSDGTIRQTDVGDNSTSRQAGVDKGKGRKVLSRVRNTIQRSSEIQSNRMQLPICSMEQEIVEAVNDHDVIILCGETGSGMQ